MHCLIWKLLKHIENIKKRINILVYIKIKIFRGYLTALATYLFKKIANEFAIERKQNIREKIF